MLADPKHHRFLDSFSRQWLRLDRHGNVAVNREAHPTYDDDFAADAIDQTLLFFREVFDSGANAMDLIDSDYTVLNDRLADHYDLSPIHTSELRRVNLPVGSPRGGLLTQASLLTMNSDGIESHPIRRGVWLLERILHRPPPPPPPNVPEIDAADPDLRGLSIRERIEKHRENEGCNNCHAKIDPWGFAFESFDATGRWRAGADASSVLPSGETVRGITDLQTHLRNTLSDAFADCMVHYLLTYALGRQIEFADRDQTQQIKQAFTRSGYQLNELVIAIIQSDLFLHPR